MCYIMLCVMYDYVDGDTLSPSQNANVLSLKNDLESGVMEIAVVWVKDSKCKTN